MFDLFACTSLLDLSNHLSALLLSPLSSLRMSAFESMLEGGLAALLLGTRLVSVRFGEVE